MKNKHQRLISTPLIVAACFCATTSAFGYVLVFDPTAVTQIIATYDQIVTTLKLAQQMAVRVQSKSSWETAGFQIGNELVKSHYGETVNLAAVMNGDALHAGQAWNEATLQAAGGGYLGSRAPATSSRMADYASIQLMDSTSTRCAAILANYKTTQDANVGAENRLKGDTFDSSDAKNATVAVLNIMSGHQLNLGTQAKSQGNLQACLAEQQTLQAKVQRDKLAQEQNWYRDVATARATAPATLDPVSTAHMNQYLLP